MFSVTNMLTVVSLDHAWCECDLNVCEHDLHASGPQAQYPGILSRARGQGTFCAIDICDDATRNSILLKARDKGMKYITIQCLFSYTLMLTTAQFRVWTVRVWPAVGLQ